MLECAIYARDATIPGSQSPKLSHLTQLLHMLHPLKTYHKGLDPMYFPLKTCHPFMVIIYYDNYSNGVYSLRHFAIKPLYSKG